MNPANAAWIPALQAEVVGGYVLGRFRGGGNFGLVFEGTVPATGGVFAVKVLPPPMASHPGALREFRNEAALLRQLNPCPGVINFIEEGTHTITVMANGLPLTVAVPYLVMTAASGALSELLEDPLLRAQVSWAERIKLWRDAVLCVHQTHHHGVAHRDIKSANCLLLVAGTQTTLRLGDFGRGKDITLAPTLSIEDYETGRGDLSFAPPEFLHFQGGASASDLRAADYYGLGSLLVELATGQGMSLLAMGDHGRVLAEAQADRRAGIERDLATLNPQFQSVIESIVLEFPRSVREDARLLLSRLCAPAPADRTLGSPFRRDRLTRDDLDWVLRRALIMQRRLTIEERDGRRGASDGRMSA